jgi:hypothetical protein
MIGRGRVSSRPNWRQTHRGELDRSGRNTTGTKARRRPHQSETVRQPVGFDWRSAPLPLHSARWSTGPWPASAPFPIPPLTAALTGMGGPRRIEWDGTRVRQRFQAAGPAHNRAPASRASISVWSRIRLQPAKKPKPEADGSVLISHLSRNEEAQSFSSAVFFTLDHRGPDKCYAQLNTFG